MAKNSFVAEVTFNSFLANVPIFYSLKTPENQRFSGVFKEYEMGTLTQKCVKMVGDILV